METKLLPGLKPSFRITTPEIWRHIRQTDSGCWEWTAKLNDTGYGIFSEHGQAILVHRRVYALTRGEDAGDLDVCHACDNPPCCRPDHLFKGTAAENHRDSMAKGRSTPWGVKLAPRRPLTVGLDEFMEAMDHADAVQW